MTIHITVLNDMLEYAKTPKGLEVVADSFTDAIIAIHKGYLHSEEPSDRYVWRLMNLVPLTHDVQALHIVGHEDEVNAMTDEEVNELMNESRTIATWAGREWNHDIPLIVIADSYESPEDIPTGNVRVVSYENERTFIYSLALLGIISVEETDDGDEADMDDGYGADDRSFIDSGAEGDDGTDTDDGNVVDEESVVDDGYEVEDQEWEDFWIDPEEIGLRGPIDASEIGPGDWIEVDKSFHPFGKIPAYLVIPPWERPENKWAWGEL